MPAWIMKLVKRLLPLEPGRYMILLTVRAKVHDWSLTRLGDVEND